jgi:acyl transferase domain-containing protein/NAD(P)-dependent dehydrogenase (short-subunit alcohol dehydrogenase family)/acyl carrier protein
MIANGKDGIVEVPSDRWDINKFYDPNPEKPGKMYVRSGGFIQQRIDEFDAMFFGISPREVETVDPQQRLLLEVAWESLEDAGLPHEKLMGSDTGVYIGGFMLDNMLNRMNYFNRNLINTHTAVSSTLSILSNRISYVFDFRGPNIGMDTACSSSLVAIHQACQGILNDECSMALAGGVNVMYKPENPISMCKGGFLSKDGRCKSFDARADGYGRGEGAGVIVLKKLSKALADGDSIYAVIRGTGVNQDGRTNGITVPNPDSQTALIRRVCQDAAIDTRRIVYFEAHGTGTAVGDPLEVKALSDAMDLGGKPDNLCLLGSVKSNIGHLEAASGVAAVIKAAMCLKKRQIPPLANLQTPNPNIPFAELGFRLPTELESIKASDEAALIGINSFGYGGTNAHAILEEFISVNDAQESTDTGNNAVYFLPLSGRSNSALPALAEKYMEMLKADDAPSLLDICYSAGRHRGHHDNRCAISADSKSGMLEKLANVVESSPDKAIASGESLFKAEHPVFVFTGMGPQWWGMGRELYRTSPVYREEVEKCDTLFTRLAGWSILKEMLAEEAGSRIAETQISQPANFLLQAGLTAVWREKGVTPAAIIGHSVGEVTAAYISGVLSLEEAVSVSFHRSRIQQKAAGLGAMLAIGVGEQDAEPLISTYPGRVSIAAANSPKTATLAGELAALEEIAAKLEQTGVFNRFLRVEVAYHSPIMDPLLPEVITCLAHLQPRLSEIPIYSTVTGQRVTGIAYDAQYWCNNMRHSVFFAKAMGALLEDGHRVFLEIGPHPVLAASIKDCLTGMGETGLTIPSLRRAEPEEMALMQSLGELYVNGYVVDWTKLYAGGERYVKLPTYPWQREKYWSESSASLLDRLGRAGLHPLLGGPLNGPDPTWSNPLNSNLLPYLQDHRVEDLVVLPGAAYVELGLALHHELDGSPAVLLENLFFHKALLIGDKDEPEVRTTYNPGSREYAVYSRASDEAPWFRHADGALSFLSLPNRPTASLDALQAFCSNHISREAHYINMTARGLQYGPAFQTVKDLWLHHDGDDVLVRIEGTGIGEARERIHPTLLDGCFQALLATLDSADKRAYVPVKIESIRLWGSIGTKLWCHGRRKLVDPSTIEGDLCLMDDEGNVQVEIRGVRALALNQEVNGLEANLDRWLYDYKWVEAPFELPAAQQALLGHWLILTDNKSGCGEKFAKILEAQGAGVTLVRRSEPFIDNSNKALQSHSTDKSGLAQLLHSFNPAGLQGILCFWGLDANHGGSDPAGIDELAATLHLIQALDDSSSGRQSPRKLFVITQGAQPVPEDERHPALAQTPLVGFMRVAVNEFPDLSLRILDLDTENNSFPLLFSEISNDGREEEISYRGGKRYARRMVRKFTDELKTGVLNFNAGDIIPQHKPKSLNHRELEVSIDSLSIPAAFSHEQNSGKSAHPPLVVVTGVVSAVDDNVKSVAIGDRVLSLYHGGLGHKVVAMEGDVYLLDKSRNVKNFASQALPFVAAHYGLRNQARLSSGETVLIHHADSPLGWAAIQVARSLGATIFATSQDLSQAAALLGMGVQQVMNSESIDVFDTLQLSTKGVGVNVVFGDLSGEYADKALLSLAPLGRLVIVETHAKPTGLRANSGRFNCAIFHVSVEQLHTHNPALFNSMVREVYKLCDSLTYLPIKSQDIKAAKLPEWKKTGTESHDDMALNIDLDNSLPAYAARFGDKPATLFDASGTYLVTGGFGGFGMETARWLAANGARHLALVGRRGAQSQEAKELLVDLESAGVSVLAAAGDISKESDVIDLLQKILKTMPPLRGIIHSAGVLDDGPIKSQDRARFENVMGPKALGAWYLHLHTLVLPLDVFVLYSSVSALVGNPGQSNYSAANVFLDSLAHARRARGLPAISINWGALSEVGMAAQHSDVQAYFKRVGMRTFTPRLALDVLTKMLEWKPAQICAADIDWGLWRQFNPVWSESPRYSALVGDSGNQPDESGENLFLAGLNGLSAEKRQECAVETLLAIISETMRIPVNKINPRHSLINLGVDSLTAMELQILIKNRMGAKVSALEIMKGNPIEQLAEQILISLELSAGNEQLTATAVKTQVQSLRGSLDILSALENLSDDELDLALEELIAESGENK